MPRISTKFRVILSTNGRLSASLVLICIIFCFKTRFLISFFFFKYALQKKVYSINFMQFWILYGDIFFFCEYSIFQCSEKFLINLSDEKKTEDASKRLSSYCKGALNCHRL